MLSNLNSYQFAVHIESRKVTTGMTSLKGKIEDNNTILNQPFKQKPSGGSPQAGFSQVKYPVFTCITCFCVSALSYPLHHRASYQELMVSELLGPLYISERSTKSTGLPARLSLHILPALPVTLCKMWTCDLNIHALVSPSVLKMVILIQRVHED